LEGSIRSGWPVRLAFVALGVACLLALSISIAAGDDGTPTWQLDKYVSRGVDRSFKCDLYEEMPKVPRVLVFGGSRSLRMDPATIKRLTGLTAFNFGLHNGRPEDAWAITDWVLDTNPTKPPAVVWCIQASNLRDVPMNQGLFVDPRLSQAFPQALVDAKMSWAMKQSKHNVLRGRRYGYDGMLWWNGYDTRRAQGETLATSLTKYLDSQMMALAGNGVVPRDTRAMAYFQKTIKLLNKQGIRPLIVIMPYQPRALAAFNSVGWGVKQRWLTSYLKRLQKRLNFRVLNCLRIRTFGGTATGFYDGAHLTAANSRRLIKYCVVHAPGCFRVPKPPPPSPSPSPSPSSSAEPAPLVAPPSYTPVPEVSGVPADLLE
jgi:hypothetical protein